MDRLPNCGGKRSANSHSLRPACFLLRCAHAHRSVFPSAAQPDRSAKSPIARALPSSRDLSEWPGFSLALQKADLDEYLKASHSPLELVPYRDIAPGTAHQVERQLYLTDLETLLELLRFEQAGAYFSPEA